MWVSSFVIITLFSYGFAGKPQNAPFMLLSKVQCQCPYKTNCEIEKCHVKPIRRNEAHLSVNVSLYRKPITNCKINIDFYRQYTTYNAFPFNVTLDACKFLKNTRKVPFLHHIYLMLANKSNINHTCPYSEDYVFVENITTLYSPLFTFMPPGSYMAKTQWIIDDMVWAIVSVWIEFRH